MELTGIDHFTIRARAEELPALHEFYTEVLGLTAGPRPDFAFAGYWMYLGGRPVVHIAALAEGGEAARPGQTGRFDHVSFRARGLAALRQRLQEKRVPFQEMAVPGMDLYQLFVFDPAGIKVEFTFAGGEAG